MWYLFGMDTKQTNVRLTDEEKALAEKLKKKKGARSLSALIAQLIREEAERLSVK